jgi:hypothetical protein
LIRRLSAVTIVGVVAPMVVTALVITSAEAVPPKPKPPIMVAILKARIFFLMKTPDVKVDQRS